MGRNDDLVVLALRSKSGEVWALTLEGSSCVSHCSFAVIATSNLFRLTFAGNQEEAKTGRMPHSSRQDVIFFFLENNSIVFLILPSPHLRWWGTVTQKKLHIRGIPVSTKLWQPKCGWTYSTFLQTSMYYSKWENRSKVISSELIHTLEYLCLVVVVVCFCNLSLK